MMRNEFQFNSTNKLLFLQSDAEWFRSIEKSFHMCIQCHLKFYYDGIPPQSPDSITTKTYHELNIYKYFYDMEKHIDFFTHDWANKVLEFCTSPRREREFSRMPELIPGYSSKTRISKVSYDVLRRSLKWLLYCLWFHNALLLPVTLSYPKSTRAKNGSEPLFEHYPELMKLLRSPYCTHNDNIPDIKAHIQSCGFSEYQIRDYAYKIITASTWRNVEDISIMSASTISHDISNAIAMGSSSYKNNLPVIPLLKLVLSMYPTRCFFDINQITAFAKSKRVRVIKNANTNGYALCENHSRAIWESLQADFISMLIKRGIASKTISHYKFALNMLMSHIYANNPSRIIYPRDYTRGTFIGNDGGSAFQDEISSSNSNVEYSNLKRLEIFFNWVSVQTHDPYVSGFSNPISKFDYPRTSSSRGTNKQIPPIRIFIRLYSFLSTLCDFYWWLITNKKYRAGQALTKKCYDTQLLGMTPIVWIEGKALPIYYIPCKLTGEAISSIKDKKFHYPSFQTLFALFVELETGIRTTHICWLSYDHFDDNCQNQWLDYNELINIPEYQTDAIKMVVSSDKVKTQAWEAYVSTRVIRMLKRQKLFSSALDGDIPLRWYNDTINGPHGKIRSIFHLKELGNLQGNPIVFGSINKQFCRLQFFFDLWQNTHYKAWLDNNIIFQNEFEITQLNAFEGVVESKYKTLSNNEAPLNDVIKETFYYCRSYSTKYTPHGIRASVVSQRVTLLPPDIIAKYITGHETINSLSHYVVIDNSMLTHMTSIDTLPIYKNGLQLTNNKNLDEFKSSEINRKMHDVISKNPSEFYEIYSPVSFSREPKDNDHNIKLKIDVISDASFFTTHICPYNKLCPNDVIESTGRYMCGQCYASIKTIAHIPRILAHMRSMNLDLSILRRRIESAIADGADPEAISPLDYEYRQLANELAAWIHTYGILKTNFENQDTRNKYFIENPELVAMRIMENENNHDRSELTIFILMLNDANEFVEYKTPNLRAQVISIASKIKMNNEKFTKALSQAGDYSLLDELRGLIKSCSDVNQIDYTRALELLLSEQPVPAHILLE